MSAVAKDSIPAVVATREGKVYSFPTPEAAGEFEIAAKDVGADPLRLVPVVLRQPAHSMTSSSTSRR